MSKVKLSVCCITYNHSSFIKDALDGFVCQKTNFPFEVLICDDASTDGTAEIIRQYAQKYPHLIKPVLNTQNTFSKGISPDKKFNWPRIQGQYVALCEGDDYWTDPYKLQKQVDFLDKNPQCTLCFHPVRVRYTDGTTPDGIFPSPEERFYKTTLQLNDLLKHNFIQTNSVVYRWRFGQESCNFIPDGILPCDWFLHLSHAQKGFIGFLPDVMAVYRKHPAGLWSNLYSQQWLKRCFIAHIKFYQAVEKAFTKDQTLRYCELFSHLIVSASKTQDFSLVNEFKNCYPSIWERIEKRALDQKYPWKHWLKYKLSLPRQRRKNKETFRLLLQVYQLADFFKNTQETYGKE